jgi:DNA-binding response OmpR family regulator
VNTSELPPPPAPASTSAPAGRLLLVEDEDVIAVPLAAALAREGFAVARARTVADALGGIEGGIDLVLLDLMLPDGDGRDVLREIRRRSALPVIVLSARGRELDKVVCLELGADDYVAKPFGAAEVAARIRAVRRRAASGAPASVPRIVIGDVELDPARRIVRHGSALLTLTLREFDLLRMLMAQAGTCVTRSALMDEVWDVNWWGSTKTLDVHISSLRRKLGDDPAAPRYIYTLRGVGFRFASTDELGACAGR